MLSWPFLGSCDATKATDSLAWVRNVSDWNRAMSRFNLEVLLKEHPALDAYIKLSGRNGIRFDFEARACSLTSSADRISKYKSFS